MRKIHSSSFHNPKQNLGTKIYYVDKNRQEVIFEFMIFWFIAFFNQLLLTIVKLFHMSRCMRCQSFYLKCWNLQKNQKPSASKLFSVDRRIKKSWKVFKWAFLSYFSLVCRRCKWIHWLWRRNKRNRCEHFQFFSSFDWLVRVNGAESSRGKQWQKAKIFVRKLEK